MASTLNIEPFLRAWIVARCPNLGRRVYPVQGVQDDKAPYCTILRVQGRRYRDHAGPDGLSRALMRIDVWSTVRAQARAEADLICGTVDVPGLDGFRGDLSAPGVGTVSVQRVDAGDDDERFEEPEQGQGQGWQCCSRDYTVFYDETLGA